MGKLIVDGGFSLEGDFSPSGSRNSALKIIAASLFCNDDVVLANVPRIAPVLQFGQIIESLGGSFEFMPDNRVLIKPSGVSSYEITKEIAPNLRQAALFVGPLVYRFGKAVIPFFTPQGSKNPPINRWLEAWESLGYKIGIDRDMIIVEQGEPHSGVVSFRTSTHSGTDNAILSSVFLDGESYINNAAEETEVDDLIQFLNMIGGQVERVEPRKIKITGKKIFSGGFYELQSDNVEVVAFSIASVLTHGSLSIKGIKELQLSSFFNFLNKVGVSYKVEKNDLSIWHTGVQLTATNITTGPFPDFLPDWVPYASLLLTQAVGTSTIHDTVYVDRLSFFRDLNSFGCATELKSPSDISQIPVISDDSYDFEKYGEPKTVLEINGPTILKPTDFSLYDARFDPMLITMALASRGKIEISNYNQDSILFDSFIQNLIKLGAHISFLE